MRALATLRLARRMRWAMAGSLARKALAISAVDRPATARRVSAICASALSAG